MAVTERIIWLPLGMRIIQYTDAERLRQIIKVQRERLSNRGPYLKGVANLMRADFRRQFAVGGDPKWRALAASTIRQKQAMGYPRLTAKGNVPRRLIQSGQFSASNVLIRSGRLRDAWGTANSPDHSEKVDLKECTVRMGPNLDKLPYARIQQQGGQAQIGNRRVTIPARPVRMTGPGIRSIVRFSQDYFTKGEGSDGTG